MASVIFKLEEAVQVLEATPRTLSAWLGGLSEFWTASVNDLDNWEPFDVVGHLIQGERTDWIPRARTILRQGEDRNFVPFDRLAQFQGSGEMRLPELLALFSDLRAENLRELAGWELGETELQLQGIHPEFGEVTLQQLIATWVVHDMTHVRQIAVRLAMRYREDVGPWREYLSILK